MKWSQKYRPTTLKDVVGHTDIINRITASIPNIPTLMLSGPPGVGKTTIAECIINDIGCESKELNTSDERGIDTVKTTIKNFAKTKSISGDFKILLLDEADQMTKDAQGALRRIMEKYELNCKFILTCNNPNGLIKAIHSRCSGGNYKLNKITYIDFKTNLDKILKSENVFITDEAFDEAYRQSGGDMRYIDTIQSIANTKDGIIEIYDLIKYQENNSHLEVLKLIKKFDFKHACDIISFDNVDQLFNTIWSDPEITDKQKSRIVEYVAEYDFRKSFSVTTHIQLYRLIARIIDVLKEV